MVVSTNRSIRSSGAVAVIAEVRSGRVVAVVTEVRSTMVVSTDRSIGSAVVISTNRSVGSGSVISVDRISLSRISDSSNDSSSELHFKVNSIYLSLLDWRLNKATN